MGYLENIAAEVDKYVAMCIHAGRGSKEPVFEALWDGDTQGWFLDLYVSGIHGRQHVAVLSYGNDMRLFNGTVPKWPEAEVASLVGKRLAALGFEVWFPSPDEPDDECPTYAERHQANVCGDCGKPIPARSHSYIPADLCHSCHRIREGHRVANERAAALRQPPPPLESPQRELVMVLKQHGEQTGRMNFSERSDDFGVLTELLADVAPTCADLNDDQFLDGDVVARLRDKATSLIREELERLGPVEAGERHLTNAHEFEGETIHVLRIGGEHRRLKTLLSLAKKFEATSISLFSNRGLRLREVHVLNLLRRRSWSRPELEAQLTDDFGDLETVRETFINLHWAGCVRDLETLELTEKGRTVSAPEDPL